VGGGGRGDEQEVDDERKGESEGRTWRKEVKEAKEVSEGRKEVKEGRK
jgi:hypothetical protein